MSESLPILRVRSVAHSYQTGGGRIQALESIDLDVYAGQLVGLMGRSGSGKTTLLNIVGGLDKPDAGGVWLAGEKLTEKSERDLTLTRRHQIGFVFQSFALLPILSARENVELPMHIAGMRRSERLKRSEQLLSLVGLGKRMNHRPFELSGGEQQRVGIARALANRPPLVLADEPTGELDSITGLRILRLFRYIATQESIALVVATHDATITEVADVTYRIRAGRIETQETQDALVEGKVTDT